MTLLMRGFHGIRDTQYATISWWRETKRELVPHHIVTHSRRLLYQFRTHFHPYAERLVSELVEKDVEGLQDLDTAVPELREDFFENLYMPKTAIAPRTASDLGNEPAAVLSRILAADGTVLRKLLPVKDLDFDYAEGAYAVYNWEIFFHVPFTIALHLSKNQRFGEAQRWFHYIFDPTANTDGAAPQRFWNVKPFRIDEVEHIEKTLLNLSTGDDLDLQKRTRDAIGKWRDNPFRPHLVARTRPSAYMYATVMAYIDNLIAWGDSLFAQDTRESINEAMQHYVLAANVLGPRPDAVPKKGSLKKESYASLRNDLDEFGNAARALEADIPFDLTGAPPPLQGIPEDVALESLGRSLYFCVPRNEKFLDYWATVGDRLYKIRNSLNLQGVFRQLPLFAPPIDPAMLARAIAAGVDVASIIAGTAAPLAPVRFQTMLQKALEICQEAKGLGAQILAAIEKKDNEALSVLRARHETNLLGLAEAVRFFQWQEATKNKEAIERNIDSAFERYRYYERLLGRADGELKLPQQSAVTASQLVPGFASTEEKIESRGIDISIDSGSAGGGKKISAEEAAELDWMAQAQIAQDVAAGLDTIGGALALVPNAAIELLPFGIGGEGQFGGSNLEGLMRALSSAARGVGSRLSYEASLSGKMAGFERREQEWALQANSAAGEVSQLFKQLRGAELREHIAKREYENHKKQVAQAKDVEDFLTSEKRKTTTESFYLWMKREAQGLHAQYFQFAYDIAKKAENAFRHELGSPGATFIRTGYLAGREGLFAGEKLYLDLKRLELAYLELNTREFEITKHISLRDWFPRQLLDLRDKGTCTVEIPEALFDLDCPGHFFRRIKSVAVSTPCVTGPFANVNCSLGLTESYVRTKATGPAGWYGDPANDDEWYRTYAVPTMSIVTSGAQSDTGMFETNLRDERYLPFEGAGVIGKWTITLLGDPHQFDYDTISDVVLTIRYTARAGAAAAAVSAEAKKWLKAHSVRLFSMRHEFPSEWARFKQAQLQPGDKAVLAFEWKPEHFPYRMQKEFTNAKRVQVFGKTTAQSMLDLKRGAALIGSTNLVDGGGDIKPPAQGANPGTFDPRGKFELLTDTTAFDDLWLLVDWA